MTAWHENPAALWRRRLNEMHCGDWLKRDGLYVECCAFGSGRVFRTWVVVRDGQRADFRNLEDAVKHIVGDSQQEAA